MAQTSQCLTHHYKYTHTYRGSWKHKNNVHNTGTHKRKQKHRFSAQTWYWFAHTINWEADHLTELKPPQARGSSSAQLSNEGHSCTSEHHCCFTGTIKPEPALPWSTHCALTYSCASEPIGCYKTVADTAASGLFYSLSFYPIYVSSSSFELYCVSFISYFQLLWKVEWMFNCMHILGSYQDPCKE